MEIRFSKCVPGEFTDYLLTATSPEDGYSLSNLHHKDKRYTKLISTNPPIVKIRIPHDSPAYGTGASAFCNQ